MRFYLTGLVPETVQIPVCCFWFTCIEDSTHGLILGHVPQRENVNGANQVLFIPFCLRVFKAAAEGRELYPLSKLSEISQQEGPVYSKVFSVCYSSALTHTDHLNAGAPFVMPCINICGG